MRVILFCNEAVFFIGLTVRKNKTFAVFRKLKGKFLFWPILLGVTALFNNMRTLKFKAQPTNAFFATVNQMFGGSSQLPTMLSELYSTI